MSVGMSIWTGETVSIIPAGLKSAFIMTNELPKYLGNSLISAYSKTEGVITAVAKSVIVKRKR